MTHKKQYTSADHKKFFSAVAGVIGQHGEVGKSFLLAERTEDASQDANGRICLAWGVDPDTGVSVCLKWSDG
jgi:hypothetical protein